MIFRRRATAVYSCRKWDHWQSNCRYQVIASRRIGEKEREGNTVILSRHLVSRRTLQARFLPFSSFRLPLPLPFLVSLLSPFSHSPSSLPCFVRTFIIPYVATRTRWFPRGYLHRQIFGVLRTYIVHAHSSGTLLRGHILRASRKS